ncbi:MAG: S8 family serine peptidase [Clostridiaceae bacterium]|jgi:subtilisin family serine protease|nr:S8 family serine peptidase [Clostridiaceae bacterium]
MIEKKLDFESYIRFARGGERSALVYVRNFSALKYLTHEFDITHKFPFINAVAVSGDFADIRRLSASPYVEYITAQSRVFTLDMPGSDTVSTGGITEHGNRRAESTSGEGYTERGNRRHASPIRYGGRRVNGYGSEVFLSGDGESISTSGLKTDFTGRGVTLAVLDTGVQPHLDLSVPVNRIKEFHDVYGVSDVPYDDNGHGTFVAGVAAGSGLTSACKVRGVASAAEIVGVKVISSSGECGAFSVLEGMQWTLDNARRLQIKVVCMSFGSTPLSSGDPLKLGAETLVKNNITVVCASGNSGENGLKSPGISNDVISVGAINPKDHSEADFSSRGWYGGTKKPDLYAAGVEVKGLHYRSAYTSMSGTSAAAPYVAGAACLLYEKYKNLTPRDVKRMLLGSAENYNGKPVIEFAERPCRLF